MVIKEVSSNAQIAVIKAVKAIISLALKEAKEFFEGLPKKPRKEETNDAKKQLEEARAKVSLLRTLKKQPKERRLALQPWSSIISK
ncbi:hypothetical protein Gorai_008404 [Gossypium raimondii]|nr:hypothetical protein [Gossypium raimondii]